MQEKFKREVVTHLSSRLDVRELKSVEEILTLVLTRYELTEISTDIVEHRGGLPEEIKSFIVSKSLKGLSKNSLKHYRRTLEHFANNISKDIKLVSTNDIRLYLLAYQHARNISSSTIDDKRRVLNSFYNWLVRENIISRSPMMQIDPIKHKKAVREPLTSLELERIRNVCETSREKALLEVLYSTGCRVSEVVGMDKSDIDYTTGVLKVTGKGNKERYCFLNAKAEVALRKYLLTRTDESKALFVMGKKPYSRLGRGSIRTEINNMGKRANIKRPVYPHLIRHTTATHMLNNGASLADVQMLLGHESAATTQVYAKLNIESLKATHKRCII